MGSRTNVTYKIVAPSSLLVHVQSRSASALVMTTCTTATDHVRDRQERFALYGEFVDFTARIVRSWPHSPVIAEVPAEHDD
jgi:hypothetical protein